MVIIVNFLVKLTESLKTSGASENEKNENNENKVFSWWCKMRKSIERFIEERVELFSFF